MIALICVVIMIAIVASTWFLGLWNSVITFVNFLLAAMVASSFFEPLADSLEITYPTYTYLLDFVCLWALFFITFVVLRAATDLLSRYRLRFNVWVEMIGRSVLSVLIAWVFLCFMLFTLHTAPLPPFGDFQASPDTENFVGAPDRLWLAFLQSRSQGALSESIDGPLLPPYDVNTLHPDDQQLDCRVFDSKSDYIYKYQHRREMLWNEPGLRVNRN